VGLQGGSGGRTLVVSLATLSQPRVVGTIEGVGGRLAVGDSGILIGSAYSPFGGDNPLGGVRSAALARFLALHTNTGTIPIGEDAKTAVPAEIEYRLVPGVPAASNITVRVFRGETPLQDLAAPFDGARGVTTWPAGTPVTGGQPYFVQAVTDEGTEDELTSRKVLLPVSDITIEWDKERDAFVAHTISGRTLIENTWDSNASGLEPPVNGYDYQNSTRTFTKAVATAFGNAPDLPDDYMLLKINSGGALVWEETGSEQLRLDVPESGRIEAKLKATRELAALQVQRIVITAEYYVSSSAVTPLKLKPDFVVIANERLHGRLYDLASAALGRGEGAEGAVTELVVGMIPIAGDGAGILAEAINAFDPSTDASKVNFALSVVGLATEFSQVTGPAGVALDKGVVFLRIGLKRLEPFTTGPVRRLPGIIYDAAKARHWDLLIEYAEGTMKLALVSGDLVARIAKTEIDLSILNRVVKRYSDNATGGILERVLNTRFVDNLKRWDGLYQDPDAVRGAIRALGDLSDETGQLIRLSDEAVEGAVKFMAKAGADLPAEVREAILKRVLAVPREDAEALLIYLRRSADPGAAAGVARLMDVAPSVCSVVP
jgi:hypothetical protein